MIPVLNLLPPLDKREVHRVKLFLTVHEIFLLLFIMVIVGSTLLFFARAILEDRFQEATLTPTAGSSKVAILNRTVKSINNSLEPLDRIANTTHYFSPVIAELIAKTPPSISWNTLTIDSFGMATLRGKANNRRDLADFKANLNSAPQLTNVNLPLQYLLGIGEIDFALELAIAPEFLKRPLK